MCVYVALRGGGRSITTQGYHRNTLYIVYVIIYVLIWYVYISVYVITVLIRRRRGRKKYHRSKIPQEYLFVIINVYIVCIYMCIVCSYICMRGERGGGGRSVAAQPTGIPLSFHFSTSYIYRI
jgi:hypothetical protein